jgi:hypothetical protein
VHARVLLLRRHGVPIPDVRERGRWFDGTLNLDRRPKHLLLRDIKSPPGSGIILTLHAPVITSINGHPGEVTFRGLEQVQQADGTIAAVCQEWAVLVGGSFYFDQVKLRQHNRRDASD